MSDPSWPTKDIALYRKMCKALEKRNYKIGLKHARAILSNAKYANHAETLAIKGLLLHGLQRYSEAFECVNKGLKQNIKSVGCWQALGHLHRSERKLEQSLKCFRNAFKIEPCNADTMRSLCVLQIQMRDIEGFRETCYLCIQYYPSQRVAFISYLVACHLSKLYDTALEVIKVITSTSVMDNWEMNELCLYENILLREAGNFKGALDQLYHRQSCIVDKIAFDEALAQVYLALNQFEDAEYPVMRLIEEAPDNRRYYEWLFDAKKLSEDEKKAELLLNFCRLSTDTPRLLRLQYLKGDTLEKELRDYLKKGLIKGIPSLFASLRFLYSNPDRVQLLEQILKSFVSSLESTGCFDGGDDESNKEQSKEPATALVWAYYFLGHHYDRIGDHATALKYIDSAIEHTPTVPEVYSLKARVYKHAGDNLEACSWAEEAMTLDLADRYLNSKCVKYMFRAGLIDEGREISLKMIKDHRKTEDYLKEMQCFWYEIELALAYDSQSQWKEALKICQHIEKQYEDTVYEQMDFHVFCFRKMTLSAYVRFLQTMDTLRHCRFYRRAAQCALKIHLRESARLQKCDKQVESSSTETEHLSAAEKKKLKSKQRKAAVRAKQQSGSAEETKSKKTEEAQSDESSLTLAKAFLHGLIKYNSDFLDTHVVAFEMYKQLEKPLLMLQCVVRACKLAGLDNPEVHAILTDFYSSWTGWNCVEKVTSVIQKVLSGIIGEPKDPIEFNEEFLKRNGTDYACRLCYAKTLHMLSQRCSSSVPDNWKELATRQIKLIDSSASLKSCSEGYLELSSGRYGATDEEIETLRVDCAKRFPYAVAFQLESMSERLEIYRLERLTI